MSESEAPTDLTPAQLDARAKKAARERERRRVQREQRERMAAAAATEAPAAGPEAPPAAPEALAPAAGRSDDDRARDLAVFLRGVVYPVVAVVAMFTPWRLDLGAYSDKDAAEEAAAWVPLARRYRWLDSLCTWASAPARMVQTVRRLARRKDQAGGGVVSLAARLDSESKDAAK